MSAVTRELPPVAGLSDEQQRGAACVWCATELTVQTAVDLGARRIDAHGSSVQWFPRGCSNCLRGQR